MATSWRAVGDFLIRHVDHGIAVLAADGTVLHANDRLVRLLGCAAARVCGRTLFDHCAPGERAAIAGMLRAGQRGAFQAHFELLDANGGRVPVIALAAPLPDDEMVCLITDLR